MKEMYGNERRAGEISSLRGTLIGIAGFEDGIRGPTNRGISDSSIKWENPQLTARKERSQSHNLNELDSSSNLKEQKMVLGPSKVTQP